MSLPLSTRLSIPRGPLRQWTSVLVCLAALALSSLVPGSTPDASAQGSGSVVGDSIEADIEWRSSTSSDSCRWGMAGVVDPWSGSLRESSRSRVVGGVVEHLYARDCPDSYSLHWIRDDTAPRMATAARDRASRLVPSLLARTAPPATEMVVNVGTWFWVPRAVWRPVSVTATVPTPYGPISVTTTARPTTLVWSPGNGEAAKSCRGPGEPWRERFGDRTSTNCMFTYRSASHTTPRGVFGARMTVVWKVTWRSSLLVGGSLPDIRTGVDVVVAVDELQAVVR